MSYFPNATHGRDLAAERDIAERLTRFANPTDYVRIPEGKAARLSEAAWSVTSLDDRTPVDVITVHVPSIRNGYRHFPEGVR